PVCSGPYRISSGDQGRYRLVRGPGARGGYSQEITVVDYPCDNDAFEAFKAGAVQVAPVPEARVEEAQTQDVYQRSAGLDVTLLSFDVSKPATADPRLRQAISLALDRLLVIDAAYGDKRQPAAGWLGDTVAAETAPACSQHVRRIADAPKAKEIFSGMNLDPATVALPLIFDERTVGRFVPQAIAIQAKDALGIQLQPQPMDPEAFEESVRTRAKPAIWILSVPVSLPTPDEAVGSLFHSGSPGNRLGFSSPEIDSVIDRARKAASREEAARLWAGAEDAVCGQMPSIPLWRTVHHWITDPSKVTVEGSGLVDLTGSPVLRNVRRG
ncbi:MAG: ABC transporter substrate-binding protein, partial [Actinomycetota bacterium]